MARGIETVVPAAADISRSPVRPGSPRIPLQPPDKTNGGSSHSTAVQILILCVLSVVLMLAVPTKKLEAADGVAGKFKWQISKLSAFLSSTENPDVIIVGSSLNLVPAVRCDDRMDGKPECHAKWYYWKHITEYNQARYLQQALQQLTNSRTLSVRNLGVMSSLMSDHAAIFDAALEQGKRPKLVISGIAPRDFMDNCQPHIDDTPAQLLLHEFNASMNPLPQAMSREAFCEAYFRDLHHVQKCLAKLRGWCTDRMCKVSGHPDALPLETAAKEYADGAPNMLKDLEVYRQTYNPPNLLMLADQARHLERMLQHAHALGTKVLLINMPLTRANSDLLQPPAYQAYVRTVKQLAESNDAVFFDAAAFPGLYSINDFEDSCHLNTQGALKFYNTLFAEFQSNPSLLAKLRAK